MKLQSFCLTLILGFCPGSTAYSPASQETGTAVIYRNREGWTTIQNRGQCNYPEDFFFRKTLTEYKNGFGIPGKKLVIKDFLLRQAYQRLRLNLSIMKSGYHVEICLDQF